MKKGALLAWLVGAAVILGLLYGLSTMFTTTKPGVGAAEGRPTVFVAIPPYRMLAERLAGERFRVEVLVGAGQNPHTYSPLPKQMVSLSQAKAYFEVGMPFETTLIAKVRKAMPELRIVDLREGIELRQMEDDHGDHEGHDHGHGELLDPHVWLNPLLAKRQARTIAETLIAIDPAGESDYREKLAALEADLEAVHAELTEALAPLAGTPLLVFHPAYGYFADAYGLQQVAVEIQGKDPTASQLDQLIAMAREKGVRVVFVQPQFSASKAKVLAGKIGGTVEPLDPLAADYLGNLREMAAKVKAAAAP